MTAVYFSRFQCGRSLASLVAAEVSRWPSTWLHVFRDAVVYHSHSATYAGFQRLKIIVFELVDEVSNHLNYTMFGEWVGRWTSSVRPPMSPDFTSLNSFLWSYVKNFVCLVENNDRQQMKARINGAVATVTCSMLKTTEQKWNILWIFDVPPGVTTLKPVGLKSLKVFLCNDAYRTSLSEYMTRYGFFLDNYCPYILYEGCPVFGFCYHCTNQTFIHFYCILCIDSTPNLLRLPWGFCTLRYR
jgi:hypothetical protein